MRPSVEYMPEWTGLSHLPLNKIAAILADDIFKWIFYGENVWVSIKNFTEVCSQESNWQWLSPGLDNGLAPNRRQAIIWTNADPIHWRIYAELGGDE